MHQRAGRRSVRRRDASAHSPTPSRAGQARCSRPASRRAPRWPARAWAWRCRPWLTSAVALRLERGAHRRGRILRACGHGREYEVPRSNEQRLNPRAADAPSRAATPHRACPLMAASSAVSAGAAPERGGRLPQRARAAGLSAPTPPASASAGRARHNRGSFTPSTVMGGAALAAGAVACQQSPGARRALEERRARAARQAPDRPARPQAGWSSPLLDRGHRSPARARRRPHGGRLHEHGRCSPCRET